MNSTHDKNMLIAYNCKTGEFTYPETASKQFMAKFDNRPLWQIFKEDKLITEEAAEFLRREIEDLASAYEVHVHFTEYLIRSGEHEYTRYNVGFVCPVPGETISIVFSEIPDEDGESGSNGSGDRDKLTGLYKHNAFVGVVDELIEKNIDKAKAGEFAMVYFDVIRFKAINDMFGGLEGNRLLRYIADSIMETAKEGVVAGRVEADRFVFFTPQSGDSLKQTIEELLEAIARYELPVKISCNMGVYVTYEDLIPAASMIDRAVLAQSLIKGSYTNKYIFYDESMRREMLGEQEISGIMGSALEDGQFVLYYQPQYNHSTGMLVGAEALVRWKHPEKGMISPGLFVPIFEKNGFITRLDLYVFEEACRFIRKCMDEGRLIVPVSTNFSRHDIFMPDFVQRLEEIRKKYDVSTDYLRVEITESVVVGGSEHANTIVNQLHECGYIVEMDDFGSGYSSLNVLKDIELDMIKLDMMFLSEGDSGSKRGGTILSSVVRMASWLSMPVIAEGVETREQADFLRSIGCDYIQGYFYSKPLPEEQYLELLSRSKGGATESRMNLVGTLSAHDFWDPKSQETLIFSHYVGGAAIFDYHEGQIEVLRVNPKYLQEWGVNISEKDLISEDPMRFFDATNKKVYLDMLKRAIDTGEEQECDTWRDISSFNGGDERVCIRSNVSMIGHNEDNYLFYAMIRNVTAEKRQYTELIENERRFKMASEQADIYYWEYTVATKEMRSCFRCIRDLGLPALLTNYPDSAIEMGIIPPEMADMYRDWHRQIAEGVEELEAVIPLTVGRVPFRVKYTTEFDENGNPVKAYGSATLVADN